MAGLVMITVGVHIGWTALKPDPKHRYSMYRVEARAATTRLWRANLAEVFEYNIKGTYDAVRQEVYAPLDVVDRRLVHALIHIDRQEEQLTLSGSFILIQCINLTAFHPWLGRTDRIDFSDKDGAPAPRMSKAQPLPTLL
jgi:hypothetical protein